MNAGARLEAFLALLYTDAAARREFLADPQGTARRNGLAHDEVEAVAHLDRAALALAASSFETKRAQRPRRRSWWRQLRFPWRARPVECRRPRS
jgi:hypothetical protein